MLSLVRALGWPPPFSLEGATDGNRTSITGGPEQTRLLLTAVIDHTSA